MNNTLQALNPLAVLDRGYAIVRDDQGHLIKSALNLKNGEKIAIQFSQGQAKAEIYNTNP